MWATAVSDAMCAFFVEARPALWMLCSADLRHHLIATYDALAGIGIRSETLRARPHWG